MHIQFARLQITRGMIEAFEAKLYQGRFLLSDKPDNRIQLPRITYKDSTND